MELADRLLVQGAHLATAVSHILYPHGEDRDLHPEWHGSELLREFRKWRELSAEIGRRPDA